MIDISRRGMLKAALSSSTMAAGAFALPASNEKTLSPSESGTVRRMYSLSAPALLA